MATYYPCLSNQTDFLSSPYLKDQMYLPQASTASYTELLSTNSISLHDSLKCPSIGPGNELEFISQTGNSPNLEPHDGEQSLRCQGLALSLGTQIPSPLHMPHYQYQYTEQSEPANSSLMTSHFQPEDGFQSKESKNTEYFSYASHGGTCNEMYSAQDLYKLSGPVSLIHNSKYLKAAQQLLDEVVDVQKALKHSETDKQTKSNNFDLFGSKDMDTKMNRKSLGACDSSAKGSSELSPSERQNLLDKLTKLCSMVDEVDRRYRQYCHQMQIVVSSFEMVAGRGAAKSYTALARYTISRQFRCLLDAINHLIQVVRQSLGEQDTMPGVEGKLTRLRYVDQQLRQQRALQQFGVMRHTWRPQRGLPENSVSILRAWLFEHFLHPYPKDSEKTMLARQTGLTRGQVANWFINARVRLWKPMVEEMYIEEFGEIDSNTSLYPSSNTMNDKLLSSEDMKEEVKENVTIKTGDGSKPTLIPSVGMKGCTARLGFLNGPHEENNVDSAMVRLQDDFNLSPDRKMPRNQNGDDNSSKFPAMYDFPELGTFSVAKQVSLALGLQQGEKDSLLMESSEMQFGGHDAEAYHCVDP